jgi:GntR family transcriptional regulator
MTSGMAPARRKRMTGELTRESPEPLYRQLARELEGAITRGRFRPGDRLDSEGALSQRFAVSRITVRQAIEELARKQLVIRKQGKGTFVTKPAVRHDLRRLHGLLASLFAQSDAASTQLLRYELAAPPPDIAQLLQRQSALALDRLYLVGGRPVALAQAWLAPEIATLSRAQADLISTEDMMRAAGLRIATSQVSLRAEAAGATIGRRLRLAARAPVLVLRRNALDADGVAKEVSRVWFCSDAYELVCTETSAENVFIIRSAQGEHT